ncbi:MAG: sulfotransferase [Candidatus Thorarchaeota archaeon]
MRNQKVIVVNGFQRGGTNIVYNIFQSHPSVCSPNNLETGEIISQNYRLYKYPKTKLIKYFIKRLKLKLYDILNSKFILNSFLVLIFGSFYDKIFYKYKKKNYTDTFNRYKYENEPYNKKEVKNSVICLKSVHNDIRLTAFLSKIYKNIFFIGLVRNGYALCEGWIRRGKNAEYSGLRYRNFCEMMIKDNKKFKNYNIIKFEDVLKNPFEMASRLYKFTKLTPISLEKLRFQVKKILTVDGHKIKFGKERAKYWFDHETVNDLLNPNINKIQIQNLSAENRKIFEKNTKSILKYFNYLT